MKQNSTWFFIIFVILLSACSAVNVEEPLSTMPAFTATSAAETPLPEPAPSQAVMYENRLLTVEYPLKIRVGDSERIIVTLQLDEEGRITPTAEVGGNIIEGDTVQIPDLYDSYFLNVEARLDLAGVTSLPTGSISIPMKKGQDIRFVWSVSPNQAGNFHGMIWVYLNLIPKYDGDKTRELILAKEIDLEGITVFGLSAKTARITGMLGTGLSAILGFPFIESLLSSIYKLFRGRPIKNSK